MNSCESRQSDFNNLKNHFQREHKVKALLSKYTDKETEKQANKQAEYGLKLQKLKEKQGNLNKNKLYLNSKKDESNKTLAQPFHSLSKVNLNAQGIKHTLEQSFNQITEHIADLRKDRTIKNELNVDVMLRIIKRNTMVHDMNMIAGIDDAKERMTKVKSVTKELINDLRREMNPDTKKQNQLGVKNNNQNVDMGNDINEQIERDLIEHKNRQKESKKNIERIDNIYKNEKDSVNGQKNINNSMIQSKKKYIPKNNKVIDKNSDSQIKFKIKDKNGNEILEDQEIENDDELDEQDDLELEKISELESMIENKELYRKSMIDNIYKDANMNLVKKAKNLIKKYEKNQDKSKTNLNKNQDNNKSKRQSSSKTKLNNNQIKKINQSVILENKKFDKKKSVDKDQMQKWINELINEDEIKFK